MDIQRYVAVIALLVVSAGVSAQNKNYKHVGERPASGQVETAFYTFRYEAPSETYASISWNAYRDKSEKRNSVLVTGLSGYDTYALSVLYKGVAQQNQDATGIAREKYPDLTFVPGPNPSCVSTPLDQPFQLSGRMVNILAMCIDARSKAVYELSISWQSLILAMQSIDKIALESRDCAAGKAVDPSTRCPDRLGAYTRSFRTFLTSFTTSGK